MNKQIERILICLLWLLAATLGTCFWLNTMFGFNLFSAQHWQYLAYMQAAQTPVRGAFYISLICAMVITLGVLYLLIKPHGIFQRRTNIERAKRAQVAPPQQAAPITTQTPVPPAQPAAPTTPAVTPTAQNVQQPAMPQPMRPRPPVTAVRSVTSNAPMPQQTSGATPMTPAFTPAPQPAPAPSINFDDIKQIFTNTGYTVKSSPQIGNFRPALLAIGTDEVLWIGGTGITQETLSAAMERLATIFSDTLDDIEIHINGFIIAPGTPVSNSAIMSFANIDELRTYMDAHRNPDIDDTDSRENFNAYSEYIDTVINYMDKT